MGSSLQGYGKTLTVGTENCCPLAAPGMNRCKPLIGSLRKELLSVKNTIQARVMCVCVCMYVRFLVCVWLPSQCVPSPTQGQII